MKECFLSGDTLKRLEELEKEYGLKGDLEEKIRELIDCFVSNNNKTSFHDVSKSVTLPDPLTCFIISFLSAKDINSFSLASKFCSRVAKREELWYRKCLLDYGEDRVKSLRETHSTLTWHEIYRNCAPFEFDTKFTRSDIRILSKSSVDTTNLRWAFARSKNIYREGVHEFTVKILKLEGERGLVHVGVAYGISKIFNSYLGETKNGFSIYDGNKAYNNGKSKEVPNGLNKYWRSGDEVKIIVDLDQHTLSTEIGEVRSVIFTHIPSKVYFASTTGDCVFKVDHKFLGRNKKNGHLN